MKQIRASKDKEKVGNVQIPTAGGGVPVRSNTANLVYPVVPLRDLDIANASTLLARFNLIMRRADKSTLAAQTDHWRSEGLDGEDFVDYVRRKGDPIIDTRAQYLKMLSDSSPILQAMFDKIRSAVLRGEKLLVLEQVPLIAWFWELAVKLVHIECATMHAALDQAGRAKLVEDFTSPHGPRVLILMFDVGGQAINLQKFCRLVFLAHPGLNYAKVEQAKGRIIRVSKCPEI